MALLTLKRTENLGDLTPGWKTITVVAAKKGKYDGENGTKYIDIMFEGYSENIKLRAHQKVYKKTGEEFCIGNIFRYANAGIEESDGKQVKLDLSPKNLVGKSFQAYFFKNKKGYTDISDNIVPATPFENIAEKWTQEEIDGLKKDTYHNRILPYISQFSNGNKDNWDTPDSHDTGPPVSEDDDWD